MLEETLFSMLSQIVATFPNVAPEGTQAPYCTFAQVGGAGLNYLEPVGSDKKFARMQINVWHESYLQAKQLIVQIENALREINATVEGAAQSRYEEELGLHGMMQDFTFFT